MQVGQYIVLSGDNPADRPLAQQIENDGSRGVVVGDEVRLSAGGGAFRTEARDGIATASRMRCNIDSRLALIRFPRMMEPT
jgi:hypothetical protein